MSVIRLHTGHRKVRQLCAYADGRGSVIIAKSNLVFFLAFILGGCVASGQHPPSYNTDGSFSIYYDQTFVRDFSQTIGLAKNICQKRSKSLYAYQKGSADERSWGWRLTFICVDPTRIGSNCPAGYDEKRRGDEVLRMQGIYEHNLCGTISKPENTQATPTNNMN